MKTNQQHQFHPSLTSRNLRASGGQLLRNPTWTRFWVQKTLLVQLMDLILPSVSQVQNVFLNQNPNFLLLAGRNNKVPSFIRLPVSIRTFWTEPEQTELVGQKLLPAQVFSCSCRSATSRDPLRRKVHNQSASLGLLLQEGTEERPEASMSQDEPPHTRGSHTHWSHAR